MKYFFITLIILTFSISTVFSQKTIPPPAPLIYKAPDKSELKEFTAADKSFQITFPGIPKTEIQDLDKAIVTICRVYRQGSNSVVSVFEFKNDLEEKREQTFEIYRSTLEKSPQLKIEAERDIQFDGMKAKEFDVVEGLKFSKFRIIISGKKLYELQSDVTNWHILSKYHKDKVSDFENETKRFFDSFKILIKPVKEQVSFEILGISTENRYENTFFGFSMDFPESWTNVDPIEIEESKDQALKLLKTNQEKFDRMLAQSIKKEIIIFFLSNGGRGTSSENFIISVLKLPAGLNDAFVLLQDTKNFLIKNPKIKILEDVKPMNIGNVKCATLMLETSIESIKIKQRLVTTVQKGFAINFTMSYLDENGRKSLEKIFETIVFK